MNTGCCMFPVKCCTCGKVLGSLYRTYKENVLKRKTEKMENVDRIQYLTKDNCEKSIEANVMDEMGVDSVCCRSLFLTHKDI